MQATARNLLIRRWSELRLESAGAFYDSKLKQYVVTVNFAGGAHGDARLDIDLTAQEMEELFRADKVRERLQKGMTQRMQKGI